MHASFSFCETDIESFGLTYAPELEDTYVFKPAAAEAHIENFEAHNGGYFYGAWSTPKEFTLRCFFEQKSIESGMLPKLNALFKVGKSGKLIFSRRPWCYYYTTVTEPIEYSLTNYLNGILTIRMKAMYPYARSDIYKNTEYEHYHASLMENTAVFEKDEMLQDTEFANIQTQTSFILANQGTERAPLGVAIAGNVGKGVIIANNTTGQSCKFVAISAAKTSNVNREVILDPINGKTIISGTGYKELAFLYHEYGFLELESSFPAVRNLFISTNGTKSIHVENILYEDLIGKYIFVANQWKKIITQPDEHTLTVDSNIATSPITRTMAISMNELIITPVTTMNITKLRFIYKPTYS